MRKKINTYEPTDINYHGGMEYGANIHAVSVQVNQYVWDMIKILNSNNLYGFNFQAKIGIKKTIVIMRHEDKELLDTARKLLKDFHSDFDFVFFAKLKRKRTDKTVWIVLGVIISTALLGWLLLVLYEKELIFKSDSKETSYSKIVKQDTLKVQEIEIDIDKLNALKDTFSEQNNSIDEPIMKMMEITTSVISSLVSEEEKAKYSSKHLVESFKGKSGIKFVAKDKNLSSDFNATVKELNSYAQGFIKDNNVSMALRCYDRVLKGDTNSSSDDEVLLTLIRQSELYENIGDSLNAKDSYGKVLELTQKLAKDDFLKYGFSKAWSLTKVLQIGQDLNQSISNNKALQKAEEIYTALLDEFRKKALDGKTINQSMLAWSLNFLADFYEKDKKEHTVSTEMRKEAILIYEKLSKKEPKKYLTIHYKTLNSLAKSYLKHHKIALASKSYTKGLSLAKMLPKKYKALSLSALGMVEIANDDFDRAGRYYANALKVYKKHPKKYAVDIIAMESLFAGLEAKKGNYKLAEQRYKKVILSYKKMNRKKPLEYNLHIAKELNKLASLKFSVSKNFLDAEIKVFEAISLCKKAKEIEYKKAKLLQADSYRYLAYLATLEQNMQTAWDYYQKANVLTKS